MRWLQKSLGLKMWLMVWLLVLLVPAWRQDALEQWDNETWSIEGTLRGLTEAKVEGLAAHAPADFAAQLERLSAQFNNFTGGSEANNLAPRARLMDDYARLSQRFPRENAIREAWLLDTTRSSLEIESPAILAATQPQSGTIFAKNWLSDAQLEAAIGAAREGAKIEPKNSFFPWMECALCFALKRQGRALAALERASRCTYFEDGTLQTARRRLDLLGRVQGVRWIDKSRTLWGLLMPHLSRMRAAARATMEVSRQRHEGGDKVGALQIAATLARAGATVSTAKSAVVTVLVGDAIQNVAWQGALKNAGREVKREELPVGSPPPNDEEYQRLREKRQQEIIRQSARYARELGQESIARQVLTAQYKGNILGRAVINPSRNGPLQGVNRLAQAFWLEARLMRLSMVGGLLWLGAFALSTGRAIRPEIKRTLTVWAAFCIGATAVLLGVALGYYNIGVNAAIYPDANETAASFGLDYKNNLNAYIGLLWFFPLVLTSLLNEVTIPRLQREKRGFSQSRVLKTLIYSAMLGSAATIFLLANTQFDADAALVQGWTASIFILIGSVLAATLFHLVTNQGNRRLAALLFWSLPWILLAGFNAQAAHFDTVWVVLIFVIALIFLISSLRLAGYALSRPREWLFDFAFRLRVLSAILALATSLAYLGAKIVMTPSEARMNRLIDAQLRDGEVKWLELESKR